MMVCSWQFFGDLQKNSHPKFKRQQKKKKKKYDPRILLKSMEYNPTKTDIIMRNFKFWKIKSNHTYGENGMPVLKMHFRNIW